MTIIPEHISIGGTRYDVRFVDRCIDNNLGKSNTAESIIEIADFWDNGRIQSTESKKLTFYHEVVHCILGTMGENELNHNEKFVCAFSSFLNEAMRNAVFDDNNIDV